MTRATQRKIQTRAQVRTSVLEELDGRIDRSLGREQGERVPSVTSEW